MPVGDTLQGRRLSSVQQFYDGAVRQPGDYVRVGAAEHPRGFVYYICDPDGAVGRLGDHEITEHEDGTITVSPSILDPDGWHGYLERGVWREV